MAILSENGLSDTVRSRGGSLPELPCKQWGAEGLARAPAATASCPRGWPGCAWPSARRQVATGPCGRTRANRT
eukprot:3179145-Pyramimonas_sp.AAC.1